MYHFLSLDFIIASFSCFYIGLFFNGTSILLSYLFLFVWMFYSNHDVGSLFYSPDLVIKSIFDLGLITCYDLFQSEIIYIAISCESIFNLKILIKVKIKVIIDFILSLLVVWVIRIYFISPLISLFWILNYVNDDFWHSIIN
jgi:hypothetical protein